MFKFSCVSAAFFSILCVAGCATTGPSTLTVTGGDPVVYSTVEGERAVARYFDLSDGSLSFVKVTLPDGTEHILPRVVAGSGARYTDGMAVVWWTQGDSATIQARNDDGEWQTTYSLEVVEE